MLIIWNSKAIEASIDMMEVRQILGIRMFADAPKRMLQVWLLARLMHHKDPIKWLLCPSCAGDQPL